MSIIIEPPDGNSTSIGNARFWGGVVPRVGDHVSWKGDETLVEKVVWNPDTGDVQVFLSTAKDASNYPAEVE